jgi:serine/threonine protein kinase
VPLSSLFGWILNVDAEVFGSYRLEELLGRGGMGDVYRAYDLEFERTVAVKRLAGHLADDPEFQERFRREAHNVARLRNPHIVPIHRYGEINGQLYIDMRYVEGGDLDDLIATSAPLRPERAVRILEQLASALDGAHANGLVHRDVKPSNALLDGRVADFCYLADFGITRPATGKRSHSLTRTGALLGSLAYMAPEQFDGVASRQSDVYSLTCVFYEMLTGERPYSGDGLPVLMHAHMRVAPPRPSERNPAAAVFDDVVARGMAKVAEERFGSAGALAEAARTALAAVVPDVVGADEPTRPEPALPPGPLPRGEASFSNGRVGDLEAGDPDATTYEHRPPARLAATADTAGEHTVDRVDEDTVDRAGATDDRIDADTVDGVRAGGAAEAPQPGAEPVRACGAAESPPPAAERRPGRRWLAPLAVAAVVLALVAATWAIARTGATVTGTPSAAPGAAPPSAALPSSAAPTSDAADPVLTEAVFTGRTSDNAITLAVGIKDGRAAGYLCDGSKVEAWLEGAVDGGKVTLRGRDASTTVEATASRQGLFGTITVGGVGRPFSATAAIGPAGLYQSKRVLNGIATRIGWIVLPDGSQVGIRNENGVRTPAPRLEPAAAVAVDGGASVPAERVTGATVVLG